MTDFITIRSFDHGDEAEIARARLAADGIPAAVRADDEGGLNPGFYKTYGVRLEVAESDLDDALTSLGIERVAIPRPIAEAIYNHAVVSVPDECCGVLASDPGGAVRLAVALTNAAHSARRFVIAPEELFGAIRLSDRLELSVTAVFHSHVRSAPYPSGADLAGGADPAWLHVIVGPMIGGRTELRAFRVRDGDVAEVSVTVDP